MPAHRLTLASQSPRRRELLAHLIKDFDCLSTDIDETPFTGEVPDVYVTRMSREKAEAARCLLAERDEEPVILAADTTVVLDQACLGKPADLNESLRMLSQLSGRSHRVLTSVSVLVSGTLLTAMSDTEVCFRALSEQEITAYWQTGEPADKAGSYAIQGAGAAFVERINGSYSGVVGLPLCETRELLIKAAIIKESQK